MDIAVGNEKLITKTEEKEVKAKDLSRRLIWILLGIGVAAVIGIAVFVVLSLNRRGSEAKQTVMLLKKCLDDMRISTGMTELIIPTNRCNEEEFRILDLSEFKKLKRLEIGSYSFENVGKVRINRLRELESIVVASHSFSNRPGVISVKDCNKLKEVVIGEKAFSFFKGFEVKDTPKLNSIVIDNYCFGNVENVAFSEMPSLVNVTIGENSFIGKNGSFVLNDCDRLSTLRIGTGSFMNYTGFRIGSTSLVDLSIGSNCFRECGSVQLNELKRLERVSIGENSFSGKEGSFIAKNELLMEDRGEILIEAKTKNDNDLREELRLCVKGGRKRDKESECGAVKRRLQCARQKRKVILAVVLHVLNVQVCVGNGVGGFVIDEVVHKTGAHRL